MGVADADTKAVLVAIADGLGVPVGAHKVPVDLGNIPDLEVAGAV